MSSSRKILTDNSVSSLALALGDAVLTFSIQLSYRGVGGTRTLCAVLRPTAATVGDAMLNYPQFMRRLMEVALFSSVSEKHFSVLFLIRQTHIMNFVITPSAVLVKDMELELFERFFNSLYAGLRLVGHRGDVSKWVTKEVVGEVVRPRRTMCWRTVFDNTLEELMMWSFELVSVETDDRSEYYVGGIGRVCVSLPDELIVKILSYNVRGYLWGVSHSLMAMYNMSVSRCRDANYVEFALSKLEPWEQRSYGRLFREIGARTLDLGYMDIPSRWALLLRAQSQSHDLSEVIADTNDFPFEVGEEIPEGYCVKTAMGRFTVAQLLSCVTSRVMNGPERLDSVVKYNISNESSSAWEYVIPGYVRGEAISINHVYRIAVDGSYNSVTQGYYHTVLATPVDDDRFKYCGPNDYVSRRVLELYDYEHLKRRRITLYDQYHTRICGYGVRVDSIGELAMEVPVRMCEITCVAQNGGVI